MFDDHLKKRKIFIQTLSSPDFWGLPKQSIISYHYEHQHPILDTLIT